MADLDKNQREILSLYAFMGAGSLMMVIPFFVIPFVGLTCAFVAFMACYFYRWRQKNNEDMVFHTSYLIRTSWWSSLILVVGIIVFGSIIFGNGDMGSLNSLINSTQAGVIPTEEDILRMQIDLVEANKSLILIAGAVSLLPYPLFIIYRVVKGVKILTKKEG